MTAELKLGAEWHSARLDLRHPSEERIVYRDVERVVCRGQTLVLARDEHKGERRIRITEAMLREAARNAAHYPLIAIDMDHQSGKGGRARGAILPESLRVGTDEKTGLPALIGDLAYNLDAADEVRRGEWLGGSVRLYPDAMVGGESVGALVTAWSLTNEPQQHDIAVRVDFGADEKNILTPAEKPAEQSPHQDAASTDSENDPMPEINLAALRKKLQLAADCSDEELNAAIDGLPDGVEDEGKAKAEVAEMSAKLAAEAKAKSEAEQRAKVAEAKVVELSGAQSTATRTVAELSADVRKHAADVVELRTALDKVTAERAAEAKAAADREAETEIELMLERNLIVPAEQKLALRLRKLGPQDEAWIEFSALHREPVRQRSYSGSTGDGAPKHGAPGVEFQARVSAYVKEHGCDEQTASDAVMATKDGAILFTRMLGAQA